MLEPTFKQDGIQREIRFPKRPASLLSVTESDYAASNHDDSEINSDDDTRTKLRQNIEFINQQTSWKYHSDDKSLLLSPTASKLDQNSLNPYLYRGVEPLADLNALAMLLGTPDSWIDSFNAIKNNRFVVSAFNKLHNLPSGTHEKDINSAFVGLVYQISFILDLLIHHKSETSIFVGGILADHKIDIKSNTDPHFYNEYYRQLLSTEIKTDITYPRSNSIWYCDSRGVQILSALYYYGAPTFLFNQHRFKIFVEGGNRKSVYTYPYKDDPDGPARVNSSDSKVLGEDFLKAIVICLLSKRWMSEKELEAENEQVTELSEGLGGLNPFYEAKSHLSSTKKAATRKSSRNASKIEDSSEYTDSGLKIPCFACGLDEEGDIIYSKVRVYSADEVARIEAKIKAQEISNNVDFSGDVAASRE